MSRPPIRSAAALALALAVAPYAAAQTAPPAAGPDMPKDVAARVDQHIKALHRQLGITTAEEPQWNQFAQVMRDNAAQMEQAASEREAKFASMNAVDDMNSYARLAEAHAQDVQKLAAAFQTLYAAFPDQQKAVADAVFRRDAQKREAKRAKG